MGVSPQQISDERVRSATGRSHEEWFRLLDAAGATAWTHAAIARWLSHEHDVDGWWAQGVTVAYEQARGMRLPGQQSDGTFSASSSRTVASSKSDVYDALLAHLTDVYGEPASTSPTARYAAARWRTPEWELGVSVGESGGRTRAVLTRAKLSAEVELAAVKNELRDLLDTALAPLIEE